jgi:aspartate-semialdehyde dehydrogenase
MAEKGLVVAIAGATGMVGQRLLEILEERDFPVAELRPLGSERSVGKDVMFRGKPVRVELARAEAFDGADLVFFAATGALSRELAPEAVARGAAVIDKSSTWRLEGGVPLVIPEINGALLDGYRGIVAGPNCSTIGFAMALEPLRRAAGLRSVVVTTMQSVSGAGRPGVAELEAQTADPNHPPKHFPRTIAGDVVPQCEDFREDGYTTEERKLLDETRKILALPELAVTMTCVRVPVAVGHSAAMLVETERPLSPADARAALAAFPGVTLVDDLANDVYPVSRDAAGIDEVLVGRVRAVDGDTHRLWLWQVSDNTRKGAALNAVQVAERMFALAPTVT